MTSVQTVASSNETYGTGWPADTRASGRAGAWSDERCCRRHAESWSQRRGRKRLVVGDDRHATLPRRGAGDTSRSSALMVDFAAPIGSLGVSGRLSGSLGSGAPTADRCGWDHLAGQTVTGLWCLHPPCPNRVAFSRLRARPPAW